MAAKRTISRRCHFRPGDQIYHRQVGAEHVVKSERHGTIIGPKSRIRRLLKNLWRRLKRESSAISLSPPLLAGAVSSGLIISDITGITLRLWLLLALAVAIMNLPKTFSRNKPTDLYTIRFARAFRDGFIPMYSAIQWTLEIVEKIRSKRQ
jgi:hypothetical protein